MVFEERVLGLVGRGIKVGSFVGFSLVAVF